MTTEDQTTIATLADLADSEIAEFVRNFTTTQDVRGTTLEIKFAEFPLNALEALLNKSTRIFNDAVGNVGKDESDDVRHKQQVDAAIKMLADFKAGKVGRVAKAKVPPLVKIARSIAAKAIAASLGKNKAKAWREQSAEDRFADCDKVIAANESITIAAKAEIERLEAQANREAATLAKIEVSI